MRAFWIVTAAVFVQYVLWFYFNTKHLLASLFGAEAQAATTLIFLGWGVGIAVVTAGIAVPFIALVMPRRSQRFGPAQTWLALGLASLMVASVVWIVASA